MQGFTKGLSVNHAFALLSLLALTNPKQKSKQADLNFKIPNPKPKPQIKRNEPYIPNSYIPQGSFGGFLLASLRRTSLPSVTQMSQHSLAADAQGPRISLKGLRAY